MYQKDLSLKDTPVYSAPHSWQGFYLGGNIGYGWSESESADITVSVPPPMNAPYPLSSSYDTEFDGVFGGLQIGYNAQRGRFVFGIEADIQGTEFEGSDKITDPFGVNPPSVLTTDLNVDWFGTVRARIGLASDRTLFYVTGGLAYGGVEFDSAYNTPLTTVRIGSDDTEIGYAIGGGLEVALDDRWSVKGEYLYVDLGDVGGRATFGDEIYKTEADVAFHAVRLGVNYKLQSEHEPLK